MAGSRGAAALAELGFTALVARQASLTDAGHFFVALTVVLLIANVCRSGVDFAITRVLALHIAQGRGEFCAPEAALATLASGAMAVIVCAVAFGLALTPLGSMVLGEAAAIFPSLVWGAVPLAMTYVLAEALKGLDRQILSQISTGTVTYLVAAILVLATGASDAVGLASAFAVATVFGLAAAALCLAVGLIPLGRPAWHGFSTRRFWSLFRQGIGLAPYRPLTLAANWIPILLLNVLVGPAEAGVYAVANRLAVAISLIGIAVEAIYAPRFARATIGGGKAIPLAREACLLSGTVTLPFGLLLALCSGWLLTWLNPEYAEHATWVLVTLCLAYSINAFLAPLGTFGAMLGKARILNFNALAMFLFATAAGSIAIPIVGALGCAFVLAAVFLTRGLTLYVFLRNQ